MRHLFAKQICWWRGPSIVTLPEWLAKAKELI